MSSNVRLLSETFWKNVIYSLLFKNNFPFHSFYSALSLSYIAVRILIFLIYSSLKSFNVTKLRTHRHSFNNIIVICIFIAFCSHARSVKYFIEWIEKGTFRCRFCRSVFDTEILECSVHKTTTLGSQDVNVSTVGVCFATTNKKPPYL